MSKLPIMDYPKPIKCTERLPDPDSGIADVLAWVGGEWRKCYFYEEFDLLEKNRIKQIWGYDGDDVPEDEPTYWMPLPPEPEGG